jgi:predicted AlkP superfamily phosphohydrolase/phosphomutase
MTIKKPLVSGATFWALASLFITIFPLPGISRAMAAQAVDRSSIDRVIILGFDGVDPHLMEKWMSEGYLPNLKKLSENGYYHPLRTANPPQSPVAWSSFATGTWPGDHGIFDFLKRNPKTYLPDVSYLSTSKPTFKYFNLVLDNPASAKNERRGPSFWKVASDQGKRVVVLSVPYSFPPVDLNNNGKMLSGLGVPDLRGTNSTFFYFATDITASEASRGAGGAKFVRIVKKGNSIETAVEGPVDPLAETYKRLSLPLSFTVDATSNTIEITLQGQTEKVKAGSWSPWFGVSYKITPFYKEKGICRFYVEQVTPEVQVYLSPLSYDPDDPYIAFTYPKSFASELKEKVGYFKTVGWVHDTSALNAEKITEGQFLDDMHQVMEKRKEMTLRCLEDEKFDLFISIFTATDRVAHMFWRLTDPKHPRYDRALAEKYGNAIRDVYRSMDEIVGEVIDRSLDGHTLLMVMSDHGFHSYRIGLDVNTWLVRNGYMTLKGMVEGRPIPDRVFTNGEFFPNVDWRRTRAYSIGTGQIYINLKGREGQGIVNPGKEYQDLVDEIRSKLIETTYPPTGEKVFVNIYKKEGEFLGESSDLAPDLQLAFRDGYCTSWETRLGGIPRELFLPNTKKWSGEHAASDVYQTSGVFLSNMKTTSSEPRIVDISSTALDMLGTRPTNRMVGIDLFGTK